MSVLCRSTALRQLAAGVLLSFTLPLAYGFASSSPLLYPPAPPPLVRFTGTLTSSAPNEPSDLHTLRLHIGEKTWLFHVDKVEKVTGTNPGWMLLNELFPPELRLIGSPDLLGSLQAAGGAGAPIDVEGWLDTGERLLTVTAVREVQQKPA